MRVLGWTLDRRERDALLARLPAAYREAVADHVTLRPAASPEDAPPRAVAARIVGEASDGRGVQAMVIEVDGTTNRPDGSTYHITWSLDPGRAARESNDVIRRRGWRPVAPLAVSLIPARF